MLIRKAPGRAGAQVVGLEGRVPIYETRGALPDVKQRMAVLGFEPVANTPEEFAARIEAEIPKWGKVIRDAISKPSCDWVS